MKPDWDDFIAKYTLIRNHLDDNACGDGFMFETFGSEVEFVNNQPIENVWTLLDCGDVAVISQGRHFVNRIGYFITEQPASPEDIGVEYEYWNDYDREDNGCAECARSFGPWYTGECEH